MAPENDPTDLFNACLLAAEQIKASGSPELNAAMRVVLFILGRDIARNVSAGQSALPHDLSDPEGV